MEMQHGMLSLLRGSPKLRFLSIEILDAPFYCLTEAAPNNLGACLGGSDEVLLASRLSAGRGFWNAATVCPN